MEKKTGQTPIPMNKIPESLRPKNSGTDTLFKNYWLEKLTRTHIAIPVVIDLIVVVVVSCLGLQRLSLLSFATYFICGWLFWTLCEYWIHRYVYHVKTENKVWLKIQHMGHGIHHQYPKDPTRLAMPPLPALILLLIFYGIFWLVLRRYAIALFPGFLLGYVLYISLHYAEHRVKTPAFWPLRQLWKNHMLHHYKYPEDKAFGVSTNLWDFVFGTLPPRND
jgi:sterol desaturase/sphingolipid hydroxylase (fatty acid hydroxylase superfamily)